MEQFNLEKWLQNKSRKVVTRDGREVEILKTNRKDSIHPIIFTILDQNGVEQVHFCNKVGICTTLPSPNKFDLFFADEENLNRIIDELKYYLEKMPKEQVEKDWKEIQDWYAQHFTNEKHNEEKELTEFEKTLQCLLECYSGYEFASESEIETLKLNAESLLNLARKEIEKSNPYSENQKQEWSKEDEDIINEVASILINDENRADNKMEEDRLAYLAEKIQSFRPQPKQEFSEEDEKMLASFLHKVEVCDLLSNKEITWIKNKLKSIKPQQNQYDKGYEDGYSAAKYNQWKPTDKQMEDFRMLLDYNIGVFDYSKFMSADSLYDDLKKNLIDE